MNRQSIFIVLILISSLFVHPTDIRAEEKDGPDEIPIEDDLMDQVSTEGLEEYWQEIHEEYGQFMPRNTNRSLREMISHKGSLSITSVLQGSIHFLFYEVVENGKLLGSLLMLTIFSALLQSVHQSFRQSDVSRIAYFIVYIVLIYITLNSFHLVFSYARNTIQQMSDFMIALLPLMLGLLASSGQVISVSFFHPIIIFLIHISGLLTNQFVFPLLYGAMILVVISKLNKNFQATQLAELLKSVALGTLGVFLSLFLAVISVQGTATAIQDGVALKTTKFITGNFIPVVGRTFTDAADTVLSAVLLLKNAIGIVGLMLVGFIVIFPAIKIIVIAFIYKLAAALLQPLGNSPIIESLTIISKYMMYVLASLITVAFMFFLAIVIIVIASNIPLLLR